MQAFLIKNKINKKSKKLNLFLRGELQVGKSTAIKKILGNIKQAYGGFKTFCSSVIDLRFNVYICSVNEPIYMEKQNCVACCKIGGKPEQYSYIFDTVGVKLLKSSNENIIVMDELGFLENNSRLFQKAVMEKIDSSAVVIGAIKKIEIPWINEIQKRKDTIIIDLTLNNREKVPYIATEILNEYLSGGSQRCGNLSIALCGYLVLYCHW